MRTIAQLVKGSSMIAMVGLAACAGGQIDGSDPSGAGDELRTSGYNCKRDKVVDAAAQLSSVVAESGYRVHVTASGGSDASGSVAVSQYLFTDDSGQTVTVTPSGFGCVYGDDPANLWIERDLAPATHYKVVAVSADKCGNTASSAPVDVTTPAAVADTTPPVLSAPSLIFAASFSGPVPSVLVMAKDDQQLAKVEFYLDGQPLFLYGNGDRKWSNPDGEDYWTYLDFFGRSVLVEAIAYDAAGNMTKTSATLDVPAR